MPSMKAPSPSPENSLASSEQLAKHEHSSDFQRATDEIPGAVAQVMTTRAGSVIAYPYTSAGCYRLLEYTALSAPGNAEHISSKPPCLFRSIHPEDLSAFELALARASELPRLWAWEGRIVLKSGKTKWISLTMQPVTHHSYPSPSESDHTDASDADSGSTDETETILWNALAQDVSAYKQTDIETKQLNHVLSSRLEARTAELAVSQTRLQKLADNVPDLLYEMRLDSASTISFPYVSSDSYRLLGLSPEQIQQRGIDMLNLVHTDERKGFKAAVRESALTMKTYRYECRIVSPSGKMRWVRTLAKPQPQSDGSVVWYGCLSDISDRKQIEAKLTQSLKELADVKFALDCSANVAITDHRGRITYVNDKFREISKYSQAELIGQTHRLVNSGHHPREFFEELWHTISNGHVWLGEIKNRAKSGEMYWVYTTIVPFLTPGGAPYQYVAIHNDITERKRAELCLVQQAKDLEQAFAELKQAQTRLIQTEKMSSLGQLVAGVAHEINNPVSFIYGNVNPATRYASSLVDLLKQYQHYYPDPPEEIVEELEDLDFEFMSEDLLNLLASMKIGAERIRQIVSSLRTFSRKDEAEKKQVNIHDGLDSTLLILGHQLKPQQNRVEIVVQKNYGELPPVICYAGQLNQVLMNILSNAIDALEETSEPTLTISTDLVDERATIRISDNGAGMDEKVRSQIFDPFFTTKAIGKGTGMGLSISYQIVTERHGGSLTCDSNIGKGTTFTIQIPQQLPK